MRHYKKIKGEEIPLVVARKPQFERRRPCTGPTPYLHFPCYSCLNDSTGFFFEAVYASHPTVESAMTEVSNTATGRCI